MKALATVLLLVFSNLFMTLAWYGHLRLSSFSWFAKLSLVGIVLFSWGIALFEYFFQVPANRIGYHEHGGPFNLFQLKMLQEVISLLVFTLIAVLVFRTETLRWNHLWGFLMLLGAVYFFFKK